MFCKQRKLRMLTLVRPSRPVELPWPRLGWSSCSRLRIGRGAAAGFHSRPEGLRAERYDSWKLMENPTAMRDVVLVLQGSLTPEGVEQWLLAANRLLGGRRPMDLIAEGDTESVRQTAQAFLDGAYV